MENVFLQILNNAITVSILILVIIPVRVLCRKMPKWITCLLWILVAAKLMMPFPMESIFSLVPTSEPIPAGIAMESNPHISSGIENVDNLINPALQQHFTPDKAASANPLQIWMYVGTVVWLAGTAVLLLYALAAYVTVKWKVRASVRTEKNIYECDDIADPFILGIIRPRIYLPSGLDEETKKYVLKHETAHLGRKDYLWKPLGFLILSVYWFQPLCWAAYILMCGDIEYACDEKVIKGETESARADYCKALLTCSMPRKMIAACPVAFGENGVKGRVKNMMNYKKPTFWISSISIVIVVIVAVCFATSPKGKEADNEKTTPAANDEMETDIAGTNPGGTQTDSTGANPGGAQTDSAGTNLGETQTDSTGANPDGTQPDALAEAALERITKEQEALAGNLVNTEQGNVISVKDNGQDNTELVWYDTFDFEGLDIQPRWYDFDGYMLYYAYDILNNEDASVVTVDVKDATSEDFSQVYYKSVENKTEEGSRISMWVMIYLGEYRDFCEVTVGAKGDDKEYRLVLPRNLDVNEQGMVEKVEKLKGRQHLNSNK